jgi:hypothetical protein
LRSSLKKKLFFSDLTYIGNFSVVRPMSPGQKGRQINDHNCEEQTKKSEAQNVTCWPDVVKETEKENKKKVNQTKPDGGCQAGFSPPAYRMSRGRDVQDEGPGAGRVQSARDRC